MTFAPQARVAVFLTSFHPGGTERQMVELVRRLDPARFAVSVACLHREGAWLPRVEEAATDVTQFQLSGFARPSFGRALRDFAGWCRARAIQIVQTCDFYANVVGLTGAALARVPVRIGSRREINPDKSRPQIALQRFAYAAAHRVVANSPAAAAQLAIEGVRGDRIRVIPNGIALERFLPKAHHSRIGSLITVANLRPEKRHDVLLEAFSRLDASRGLTLRIVGDGSCRAALECQARDLGVAPRVEFLGHREDVAELLATSDLFVLPSQSEAFPNGALEAMATGLPVVASSVGGLLDLIEHERNGLLVPPANPQALAEAIERLIAQPTLATALGESARRHVRDRYSFERTVAGFEHLFLSELHARAPLASERTVATSA
ncbi:MAG TPA: glycosyltransferase [Vicinamibacterales bacterium]|nr:glycosyltransferase [Vicinamibacterales bacterium]